MLDIYDLEIRHKKYKQKLLIPYIAIAASIIVILTSIIFFTLYDFDSKIEQQLQQQIVTQENIAKPVAPQDIIVKKEDVVVVAPQDSITKKDNVALPQETAAKPEHAITKENVKTTQTEERAEEKVVLSPSLNFINNIKSQTPPPKDVKKSIPEAQKKQEEVVPAAIQEVKKVAVPPQKKQEVVVPAPPTIVEERLESVSKADNKNSIDIKRKNNEEDDIKDVIKRFNVNHNPALSLFIAKRYYQLGEYEKAYNYALTTNEINNNIEESWIIFSKSLIKMNKKDMAVETLKKYIGHSQSSQAKQLLDEIQSGKFK
jgi:hypothetical protein